MNMFADPGLDGPMAARLHPKKRMHVL